MKRKEDIELIHGSGKRLSRPETPDADVKQLKGILAADDYQDARPRQADRAGGAHKNGNRSCGFLENS